MAEIVLRCPNCGVDNVGSNDVVQATAQGEWVQTVDTTTGKTYRTFVPGGYTDVHWDSQEADEDDPCFCQSCTWQGSENELLLPDQPKPNEAMAMIEDAIAEHCHGETTTELGSALEVLRARVVSA